MDKPQIGDHVTIPWRAGRIEGKVVFVDHARQTCKVTVLRGGMSAPHRTLCPPERGHTFTITHAWVAVWPYAGPGLTVGDWVTGLWGGIPVRGKVVTIDDEQHAAVVTFRWGARTITKPFGWHLLSKDKEDETAEETTEGRG